MGYQPPYSITSSMLKSVAEISERVGQLSVSFSTSQSLRLRRANRIRTVQGSLAIEGNTLNEQQITEILAGKRVIAPPKEILEVQNALQAYSQLERFRPEQEKDLLKAHKLLMNGLVDDAGVYRQSGVGVMSGTQVVHMAPGANQVPRLMKSLFQWLKKSDLPPLISSCIFHYEFEFIHPFSDGNGRMGRLWQTLMLAKWQPIFNDIPIESLIHQYQQDYYHAIRESTKLSDSAPFIEFMLNMITQSLALIAPISSDENIKTDKMTVKTRVEITPKTRVKMKVEMRVKNPNQSPIKASSPNKNNTANLILALLTEQPDLTLSEVAFHLGKSTSTIERAAAKLKQQQQLIYVGSKKSGYWQVLNNQSE